MGAERLGATGGEQAGFKAGGAEDGLLAEGHALEGEQFLGIDGAVGWREVGVEVGDFWMSSRRTTVKLADAKPCLRAFWEERALPVSLVGPVKRAALARLAGKPLFGDGACSSAVGANRIRAREYPFAQHLATEQAGRNWVCRLLETGRLFPTNCGDRLGDPYRSVDSTSGPNWADERWHFSGIATITSTSRRPHYRNQPEQLFNRVMPDPVYK